MTRSPELWIPFGRVSRAHGLKGEVRVVHHNLSDPFPANVTKVRLWRQEGDQLMAVVGVRATDKGTLVRFEQVKDRDAAQQLVGGEVQIASSDLPALDNGEFFLHELLGARAEAEDGRSLGVIESIVDNHGQDLAVVRGPKGELLMPLAADTVRVFERGKRRVVLRVVEGLWD